MMDNVQKPSNSLRITVLEYIGGYEKSAWKIMFRLCMYPPKCMGTPAKLLWKLPALNQIASCLISEKLMEFNRTTGDGIHKVEESYLEGVVKLAGTDATANPLYMQVLKQLLEWPQGECELYVRLENWCKREGKLLCSLLFIYIYIYIIR
jgi:hypothetical protein